MAHITPAVQTNDKIQNIGRYLAVGLMGTILDIGLYAILHIFLGMPILLANSI